MDRGKNVIFTKGEDAPSHLNTIYYTDFDEHVGQSKLGTSHVICTPAAFTRSFGRLG